MATVSPAGVVTAVEGGTAIIRATEPGGIYGEATVTVEVIVGPATQLTFTTQPSASVQSGAVFPQQPAIQLRDSGGNPVSQAGVDVTASIGSGAGTLGGTLTVATDGSGVATFPDLVITGTVGDRTLDFDATGLTGTTSNTVTVTAGDPDQLTITTQPSASVQSGVVFPQQPAIQVQDASDNDVNQAGVDVTVAIASGAGTLGGTLTVATDGNGIATFTDLVITGNAGDRTLRFTSGILPPVISNTVTVTP